MSGPRGVDMWVANSDGMRPPWPTTLTVEVVFEADLPNGPYAEWPSTSQAKLMLAAGSDATTMGRAALDALVERHSYDESTAERLRILDIKFKGGKVQPAQAVQEGTHNVTMGALSPGDWVLSGCSGQSVKTMDRATGASLWVADDSQMRSPWPMTLSMEVSLEADLPDGPYAEWTSESSGKLMLAAGSDATTMGRAALDALAERHSYDESSVKSMRLLHIKFKGGEVQPAQAVKDGVHEVKFGMLEPLAGCCTLL